MLATSILRWAWALFAIGLLLAQAAAGAASSGKAPFTSGGTKPQGPQPIVGGQTKTNPSWVVSFGTTTDSGSFCGGTLIGSEWVLTAAHCLASFCLNRINPVTSQCLPGDLSSIVVRIGGTDTRIPSQFSIRGVDRLYIPPGYFQYTSTRYRCTPSPTQSQYGRVCVENPFDIALVRLSAATSHAPIPYSGEPAYPCVNDNVYIYGWGTCRGSNCTPPCVPPSCISQSQQYTLQWTGPAGIPWLGNAVVSPTCAKEHICINNARGNGPGDSGGPYIRYNGGDPNNPMLIGVVSFGSFNNGSHIANNAPYVSGAVNVGSVAPYIRAITGIAPSTRATSCRDRSVYNDKCWYGLSADLTLYDTFECGAGQFAGSACFPLCRAHPANYTRVTCLRNAQGVVDWVSTGPTLNCPIVANQGRACSGLAISGFDTFDCSGNWNGGLWPTGYYCKVRCSTNLASLSFAFCAIDNFSQTGGTWQGRTPPCTFPGSGLPVTCAQLNLGPNYDTSQCALGSFVNSTCTVKCRKNPTAITQYRCLPDPVTSEPTWVGGTVPNCAVIKRCFTVAGWINEGSSMRTRCSSPRTCPYKAGRSCTALVIGCKNGLTTRQCYY